MDILRIEEYFDRLWPLNRSLTGEGNRETLRILQELVDLQIHEIPSGTQCFDWTVPPEWTVHEAWIEGPNGDRIIDFADNNLHLVGYSVPFAGQLDLQTLKTHLHSRPDMPHAIPYVCSYYSPYWGFCMKHAKLNQLEDGLYTVRVDSELNDQGTMTLADAVLPGESNEEVLFSTYICHPSMANNELAGLLVAAFLYRKLKQMTKRRYTYRFLFAPETIGAICYLSRWGNHFKKKLVAGWVITTVGDAGSYSFRRSRRGDTLADRVSELVLKQGGDPHTIESFDIDGSDERQYCSPGFNLPVASLTRTRYGRYPEYHTSADNKEIIDFNSMTETISKYYEFSVLLENNRAYRTKIPFCEPMLGKRNLHASLTTNTGSEEDELRAFKWLLNLADGKHDLIGIAELTGIHYRTLLNAVPLLLEHDLIEPLDNCNQ